MPYSFKGKSGVLKIQNQSETHEYEKMISLLTNFIEKSNINIDRETISGYSIVKGLCEKVLIDLKNKMYHLGRIVLNNEFQLVYSTDKRILEAVIQYENERKPFRTVDEFIVDMEQRDSNERWEYLKFYLNGLTYETPEKRNVMDTIGSVFFYKINFKTRQSFYEDTIGSLNRDYGAFALQYLSFIEDILYLISKSVNPAILIEKLNSQLSPYDCLLLLYNIWGRAINNDFISNLYRYIDFRKIIKFNLRGLMIDSPSDAEIIKEIELGFPITEIKQEE